MGIEMDMTIHRGRFSACYQVALRNGITGVFGRSGSGKTTLLHLISGLLRPDQGWLSIMGRELVNTESRCFVPPEKRNIGMVFQDIRLFPHMSVRKNLLFSMKRSEHSSIFDKVTELLDLDVLLNRKPQSLSGGQQQRVALGRALIQSPSVLLLDEPFSAIDTEMRFHILPYIRRIQSLLTIPILLVSHELSDILRLTAQLVIIRDGRNVAHDNLFNLIREPEIYSILRRSHLSNRLDLIFERLLENGNFQLRLNVDSPSKSICKPVRIESSSFDVSHRFSPEEPLNAILSPSAIAISKTHVCGISEANQIRGIIKDFVEYQHNIICIVDIGTKIFVEITGDSFRRLALERGLVVYCLFKSSALVLYPTGTRSDIPIGTNDSVFPYSSLSPGPNWSSICTD